MAAGSRCANPLTLHAGRGTSSTAPSTRGRPGSSASDLWRLVVVAAWLTHGWWTVAVARSLVCDANAAPSDAILVENFDTDYLVFERAAELRRAGLAPRVLIPVLADSRTSEPNDVAMGTAQVMARIARLGSGRLRPDTGGRADFAQRVARRAPVYRAGAYSIGDRRVALVPQPTVRARLHRDVWPRRRHSHVRACRRHAPSGHMDPELAWHRGCARAVDQASVLPAIRAAVSRSTKAQLQPVLPACPPRWPFFPTSVTQGARR